MGPRLPRLGAESTQNLLHLSEGVRRIARASVAVDPPLLRQPRLTLTQRQPLPWNHTEGAPTWTGASRTSRRLAGTTSRTLRHYDSVGLLEPSRIGSNGYRYYDEDALATPAAHPHAARPGPEHPRHRGRARRPARPRGGAPAAPRTGCSRRRTGSIARSSRCRQRSRRWKEVNNSWQRRCSRGSTTPSTRMRSSSAGARTRTRSPTPGGAR